MALTVGTKAPDFKLPSTEGKTVSLKELKGKKVVLYFYPKDDTPGCTREACDFRDNLARVKSQGALVYGVSKDSIASHDKFREKYELPFPLLSDEGNATAQAYEAFGEKTLYGRKSMGTIRSTYLIGEDGKIAAVWSPVKVDGHVDKVLAALKGSEVPAGKPAKSEKPAKSPKSAKKK
jgi:peroxiredoxin Q/BCP